MTVADLAPRTLGRPRDPKLDDAITAATLELLGDSGYTALTVEAVAARAGVGKATLYRRWAGKEQLVLDALRTLSEQPEPDATTGVRDEIVLLLEAIRRKSTSSVADKIFARLVSESTDNPELVRRYREQVLEPRRERFRAVLRRGVAEGLLRADVDLEHALDLFIGPMVYRNMTLAHRPPGPDLAARIADDVLVALAPRTPSCPPARTTDRTAPQEDA